MFSNTRTNFSCHKYLHKIGEDFYQEGTKKFVIRYNKYRNRYDDYVEK